MISYNQQLAGRKGGLMLTCLIQLRDGGPIVHTWGPGARYSRQMLSSLEAAESEYHRLLKNGWTCSTRRAYTMLLHYHFRDSGLGRTARSSPVSARIEPDDREA